MPQQKIGFFGQFRPTGVDPTAGSRARALAGLSEQVQGLVFKEGAKRRVKAGGEEGAASVKRDEDGNVIAPERKSDFTLFGQSFNQAAVLAHRAQIGIDTKESLDRIQEENKLDPEAFKSKAQAYKKGALEGMPPELANIAGLDIDSGTSNRLSVLNKAMFERETQKQKAVAVQSIESAADDILTAVRNGDEDLALELSVKHGAFLSEVVESGLIDPVAAEKIRENIKERSQEQKALSDIDEIIFNEDFTLDQQIEKGVDFLDSLRERDLDDLSPEQKDSLLRVVGSKIESLASQRAAMQNQRDLNKEKVVSNLKIQADLIESQAREGEVGDLSGIVEQTEALHSKGDLTKAERTSVLTHVAKAQDEVNRISLANKRIVARSKGDNSIVMNQKDVDFFYKKNIQDQIEDLPADVQAVANANFIRQTMVVPVQVRDRIENNILSGDPDLIKESQDLIDRLDSIPGLESVVTSNQRAFVSVISGLSKSLEPAEAIKIARELTDPNNKARVDAREQEIKGEKFKEDYSDIVNDSFETMFGVDQLSANINKEILVSEYSDLFEAYFKNGMGEDRAQQKALDQLHTNWKDSQFGFMKYPPEEFYSVGGNVDYIKDQLTKDITSGFAGFTFNKDDIHLLSDEETARTASQGRPDYKVIVIDSNGEFQALQGRWKPDQKAEIDKQTKANQEKFIDRKTDKARFDEISKQLMLAPRTK